MDDLGRDKDFLFRAAWIVSGLAIIFLVIYSGGVFVEFVLWKAKLAAVMEAGIDPDLAREILRDLID